MTLFTDRADAGRRLAARLGHLRGTPHVVVLGIPRGGVPVAEEVARALDAPLDVIIVRKIGVPSQPELGMGAIGEQGTRFLNDEVIRLARVTEHDLARVESAERAELERRAHAFRAGRPRAELDGRTVVIVDDGIATGSTARVACRAARSLGAARVVLAVPVAPPEWTTRLRGVADELVAVATPEPFHAVGQFYADFAQTTDEEVVDCLRRAAARRSTGVDVDVELPTGSIRLGGHLTVPDEARGAVVFVHGSGSSRHSPRNRFVAGLLQDAGLATLLFDLLTTDEEGVRANVFDIELLARRLVDVTAWLRRRPEVDDASIGYFGASTGAAAALWAAAEPDADIAAVVSRGGRPDLAAPRLSAVRAPTLLVVGGRDDAVLRLNRRAQSALRCVNDLVVVPGATHVFEEPGTLRAAADVARDWFTRYLGRPGIERAPRSS